MEITSTLAHFKTLEEEPSIIYLKQQGSVFDRLIDVYADLSSVESEIGKMEEDFLFYLESLDYTRFLNNEVRDRLDYLLLVAPSILEDFSLMTKHMSFQLTVLDQRSFFLTNINFYDRNSTILTTRLRVEGVKRGVHTSPRLQKDYRANEWYRHRLQQESS